jgi:nucleoside-diphosphate-sugar epimerase
MLALVTGTAGFTGSRLSARFLTVAPKVGLASSSCREIEWLRASLPA